MKQTLTNVSRFVDRLRGGTIEYDLKPYREIILAINDLEDGLRSEGDDALRRRSADLKARALDGISPDELAVEAFALVREVSQRTIGLRPYDVQLLAGIAMHRGRLVEMQTGEGKTLAAVLPGYLNALPGGGMHVLTFSDYLARRDSRWMGPIYEFLGLSVGCIHEGMEQAARRRAYGSDITYATAKEAGFDYLRDALLYDEAKAVHRGFNFALVDEADSILIDEARVPLVIAGSAAGGGLSPSRMAEIVAGLESGLDYETDEYARNVHFTESGLDRLESELACGNLHSLENIDLLTGLNLALHARVLIERDVDYIVRNGRVEQVDEFTGRVVEDRQWPDGLQAAIEAKENLDLRPEGEILGSITIQHFLKHYPRICGMTATAQSAAEELKQFYDLDVAVIPSNRACVRVDHSDLVFTHKEARIRTLIEEIGRVHQSGRPILVGTVSVEESDRLAMELREAGIDCPVLNARNDSLEAEIIAQAGSVGAVTISTNMAGRGTDIKLGGENEEDREKVSALGGLYVIGTNRHESLRIDRQLRGRAGRQGDPGSSRFFVSLEDDLLKRYGVKKLIGRKYFPERMEDSIENPLVNREIARTQRIVENQNFEIRKTLWKYSSLVEMQRKIVSAKRREVLMDVERSDLLRIRSPEHYGKLLAEVGADTLGLIEKRLTLHYMDRCWTDHLAFLSAIRENIHLVKLGGRTPLDEFHKLATDGFLELLKRTDDEIIRTFDSLSINGEGVDLEMEELRGPSSTWTYLINDDPFADKLGALSVGERNLGYAVGAALMFWPLFLGREIYRQIRRWRADGDDSGTGSG